MEIFYPGSLTSVEAAFYHTLFFQPFVRSQRMLGKSCLVSMPVFSFVTLLGQSTKALHMVAIL